MVKLSIITTSLRVLATIVSHLWHVGSCDHFMLQVKMVLIGRRRGRNIFSRYISFQVPKEKSITTILWRIADFCTFVLLKVGSRETRFDENCSVCFTPFNGKKLPTNCTVSKCFTHCLYLSTNSNGNTVRVVQILYIHLQYNIPASNISRYW